MKPYRPTSCTRAGGRTNEMPGTDHVTSGPMRGLENNRQTSRQTEIKSDRHTDMATLAEIFQCLYRFLNVLCNFSLFSCVLHTYRTKPCTRRQWNMFVVFNLSAAPSFLEKHNINNNMSTFEHYCSPNDPAKQ